MMKKTTLTVTTRASLARDERYICLVDDSETVSVHNVSQTPNAVAYNAGTALWRSASVRCALWHFEEPIILVLKKNGSLEWKSFCNDTLVSNCGVVSVDHLLRLLVSEKLEFNCLNSIDILTYQRNHLILQTSARQIVALELFADSAASIAWSYMLSEFEVFEVCDRFFLVFEPISMQLSVFSLFTGKLWKKNDVLYSEHSIDLHIAKISLSPNRKHLAILGTQLCLGNETKLECVDLNGQHMTNMSMGDENIALIQEQPPEYLLYNYSARQIVHTYSVQFGETLILCQRFNRFDKVLRSNVISELGALTENVTNVKKYAYDSMLANALASHHFESCANILKLAGTGSQSDLCKNLEVLNEHILANANKNFTNVLQKVIGAGLRFACQAYQKYPSCSRILEFIFSWQDILLSFHQKTPAIEKQEEASGFTDGLTDKDLQSAILENQLPLGQQRFLHREKLTGNCYRDLDTIREIIMDQIVEAVSSNSPTDFLDRAVILTRNLGCTWECLIWKCDDSSTRRTLADFLVGRELCSSELYNCVDFLDILEKHHKQGHTTQMHRAEAIKKWESEEKQFLLAEMFLQEKDNNLITRLEPLDVWKFMVQRQILTGLRKWIETQCGTEVLPSSIPYSWPIDNAMIDFVADSPNHEAKETILNLLALHGIFTKSERTALHDFVVRTLKISRWGSLEAVLEQRNSNVSCKELLRIVVSYSTDLRKTGLLWDMLNFIRILNSNDLPAWLSFVHELHTNRRFLPSALLEEILSSNGAFLQEECTLRTSKIPALMTGALLLACLAKNVRYETTFSSCITERTSIEVESQGRHLNSKQVAQSSLSSTVNPSAHHFPAASKELDPISYWFFLIPHLRPIDMFHRIRNCINSFRESTSFCLKAGYAYGIRKKNNTLSGVFALLLKMCAVEGFSSVCASRRLRRDSSDTGVSMEGLTCAAETELDNVEAISYDESVGGKTDVYHCDYTNLSDCLGKLLIVHEDQHESVLIPVHPQPSDTAQALLRCFLIKQCSVTSNDSCVSARFSAYAVLKTVILSSISDLSGLSGSLFSDRKMFGLACARVMTECTESLSCLYIYMAARIPANMERCDFELNVDTVCYAILHAIESSKFDVVVEAFNVIAPGQLTTQIVNWLDSYSANATSKSEEELLNGIVSSSENRSCQSTYPIFCKIFHPSPHLLSWFCKLVVHDPDKQLQLLLDIARITAASPLLGEIFPHLGHLTKIATAGIEFKINIETSVLLTEDASFEGFKRECEKVVKVLLRKKEFSRALEVTKSCGLPIDSILATQLSSALNRLLGSIKRDISSRNAFWHRCSDFFIAQRVQSKVASTFFRDSCKHALNSSEKHTIIDFSLSWAKKIAKPTAEDENLIVQLEILWWETKIEAVIDGYELPDGSEDLNEPPARVRPPLIRAELEGMAASLISRQSCKQYAQRTMDEVLKLIGFKLDHEDLYEAFKLSTIFNVRTKDLNLILLLMSMAENPSEHDVQLEEARRIVPLDDSVTGIKDHLTALEAIVSHVTHGRRICDRLLVFYHVAVALDMSYTYVVEHKKPLCIVKMLVEHSMSSTLKLLPGLGGLFSLANRWTTASNIGSSEIVVFVRDELVETIRCAQSKICDTEASMVVSLLQGTFNRWVTLCKEPIQLGNVLMASSLELQRKADWVTAVEVLIFAHSSFTLACNVENIRQVLSQARHFIELLAADKNWTLITRLLTGLQRYAEMNYVFTMLKEADQFEYFLRKGMDRLPLLRQALLDFLRPSSSKNRELFRLVALHFHMHAEVATLWEEEANLLVTSVVPQTHGPLVRSVGKLASTPLKQNSPLVKQSSFEASQKRASPMMTMPKMATDQETKNKLQAAVHNLAHAAEYYVQAGKLDHANNCVLTAELYALQLSLLQRNKIDKDAVCVLGLTPPQVNCLIEQTLTYPEAELLSRYYGTSISWGRTLLYRYVINGENDYLEQFIRRQDLSPLLVDEMLTTFQSEGDSNSAGKPEVFDRFSKILSAVPDVELSYRVGSRLSLVPLVTGIISSPSLSFLKDIEWGKS